MTVQVELRVHRTAAELDALEPDWAALEPPARDPLLSLAWFRAAAGALHAGESLCTLTLHRDGRLAGVAPLVESRRDGARHLEFIGSNGLYEPSSLIAADSEALSRLCHAIVDRRLPAALLRFPGESGIAAALHAAARGRGRVLDVASPPCAYADLLPGWPAYLATRDSKLLHEVARKRRRLAAKQGLGFEMLSPRPDEVETVIDEAVDVEADGWKSRAGSAMRHNPRIRDFIRTLATSFAARGALRVAFLRSGGRAIAMRIMLEWDRRLWAMKTGYRESERRWSPGMLLTHDTLEEAGRRGLRGFEFLGSGDRLQPAWTTGTRALQSCVYYPYSLRGAWTFAVDAASQFRRRRRRFRRSAQENKR